MAHYIQVDLSLFENKVRDILQTCISIKNYNILLLCEETLIPILKLDNNTLDLQYVFFDVIKKNLYLIYGIVLRSKNHSDIDI